MSKPIGLWSRLRMLLTPWRLRRASGRGRPAIRRARRHRAAVVTLPDGRETAGAVVPSDADPGDHLLMPRDPAADVQPAGRSRQRRLLARRRSRAWEGRVSFEGLEGRALLSASPGDNRFFGAIVAPGQVDTYTLTTSSTTQLWFDSQTPDSSLTWSVTGPQGTLGEQSFWYGDGQLQMPSAGQPSARGLIPAGTYTVKAAGSGDATGAYSFRILDLASATTITPGTAVSGTLPTPNGTSIYKLPAAAGDKFSFTSITAPADGGTWRLLDPYGNQVFSNSIQSNNQVDLPATGTYTLILDGYSSATRAATFSFVATRNSQSPPPAVAGTTITPGTAVSGTVDASGTTSYKFTLASATRLWFDSQTATYSASWKLTGPQGVVQSETPLVYGDGNLGLLPAGTYSLAVSGTAGEAFAFDLLDASAATSLTLGTLTTATLDPANSTKLYRFSGTAGQVIYLDNTGFSSTDTSGYAGAATWRVFDQYGTQVGSQWSLNADSGRVTLPTTGTYTLALEGYVRTNGTTTATFTVGNVTDTTAALTLGTPVTGTIGAAGQEKSYTFTLSALSRIWIDSRTSSYTTTFSLEGGQGTVQYGQPFGYGDQSFRWLPAGDYTLRVRGDSGDAFAFSVLDFAAATGLTLGASTTATLDPASSAKLYKFTGTAGQVVYVDTTGFSSTDTSGYAGYATWFLYDPYGIQVGTWSAGGDSGRLTLPTTGTYTLAMDGHVRTEGTTTATFTVWNVTDTTTTLTLGTPVTGTIGGIGQVKNYTFTLSAPARLWFDSRTGSYEMSWKLTGGQGVVRYGQPLGYGDNDLGLLPAGTYSLEVSGNAGEAFAFNVLDLSAATSLTLGTSTTATLDPSNSTKLYKFTGTAGQVIYLDNTALSTTDTTGYAASSTWVLYDPYANVVGGSASLVADLGRLTLPIAGTYTLVLQGYVRAEGTTTTTFTARSVTDTTAAMTLGSVVSGTISAAGQRREHTFTLASTTQLWFDSRTADGNLFWSVTGPQGVLGEQSFGYGEGQLLVPWGAGQSARGLIPAGTYKVTVVGGGDATGSYAFRMLDLATATAITPGTAVSGSLPAPNGTSIYKLSAAAGDNFSFTNITATGEGGTWRLLDPYGNQIFAASIQSSSQVDLPATGTYTLILDGYASATQAASFSFVATRNSQSAPPAVDGTTITPGTAVSGTVDASGTTIHQFTLASAARLWFDTRTASYSTSWKLTGPQGVVQYGRQFSQGDQQLGLLPAGTYALEVTGTAGDEFAFNLVDGSAATSLTLGASTTATLDPSSSLKLYTFTGTAGQVVYLDNTDFTTTDPNFQGWWSGYFRWSLYDSFGNLVGGTWWSLNADSGRVTLPAAGAYTLVLQGYDGATGTASTTFTVRNVADTTASLTLGTPVAGTIGGVGQEKNYTFTLAAPTRLMFDSRTASYEASWKLTGPQGVVQYGLQFSQGDRQLGLLPAGTYTLTVSGSSGQAFEFNLLDMSAATSLTLGASTTATLDPSNAVKLYKFTGTAGQVVYLDNTEFTTTDPNLQGWGGYFRWSLYDSFGNAVGGTWWSLNADSGRVTLPAAGTYTLVLQGYDGATGTSSAKFTVWSVTDTTAAMTVGTPVTGTIGGVGQEKSYTFTLAAPTRIWIDGRTSSPTTNYSLVGRQGTVVSGSFGYDQPVYLLPAGDYTLRVAGESGEAFAFNVLDFAAATNLAFDVSTTATLNPSNSTRLYKFTGTAGQVVFLDSTAFSTTDTTGSAAYSNWRLFDPYGNVVAGTTWGMNADSGRLTLPMAGTYTLVLEGANQADGTTTATFTVRSVVDDVRQLWGTTGGDAISLQALSASSADVFLNGYLMGTVINGTPLAIVGRGGSDAVTVVGTGSADTFTITPTTIKLGTLPLTLSGIATRSVDGAVGDDTFNISGANPALSLLGNAGVDAFVLADAANVASIDGGANGGRLDYSAWTTGVVLDTAGGNVTGVTTVGGITAVVGSPRSDAPIGAAKSIALLEDAATTFAAADFAFTDPGDSPAHALAAVKITTLPTAGTLKNNGVAVTAGGFVTAADIAAGKLVYTPVANGTGSPTFTFQVQDAGGTAGGGIDLDPTPRTMTLSITAVNDPPVRTAGTVADLTVLEDAAVTSLGLAGITYSVGGGGDETSQSLSYKVTAVPAVGKILLADNTTQVTAGTTYTLAQLQGMKFQPTANASGSGTFSFSVQDTGGTANGGVDALVQSIAITVTPVNDAPAGAARTVTTLEDTPYTFTVADLGFTDPSDTPANALSAVKITTLPTAGSLKNNGVAVTAGASVAAADIASGKLVYTPVANASGSPTFTFQVQDDGGTANGGADLDPTARTMTVSITSVNDAPSGTAKLVTTLEDTAYTFTVSDFGFTDPADTPANALAAVKITTLPTVGTLRNNGVTVTAGGSVSAADIAAGKLVYGPAANATAVTTFTFQVQDNGGTANGGVDLDSTARTMTVSITSVNDAPVGTAKTVTTLEDTAYTFTASDFGFTDPSDTPANSLAAVKITTLPAVGTLRNNGVAVTAGASVAVADITTGKLVYTPAANATAGATFTFQVQDDGGTANGGVDLDPTARTMTVSITSVNDAPAGTAKTVGTLKNTDCVFTAADFGFMDPSDTPANFLAAVKITTLPATGTLKNNGVAVTAGASVTAAAITAGKLVYSPAANATGTVTFTFQVQDDGGTANGGIDLDPTARTMTVTVAETNAAPTDITLSAASVLENRPSGTVVGTLTTADPDAGNTFTYTLVSGTGSTDNASFAIAGNELRTAASFDFETKSSYSVRVRSTDQGGLSTEKAFTVSVTNVNEAPAGAAKTVTTLEDTAYTFTVADFGFTDPSDTPANVLAAVKITTLPTAGSLKINGVAVTAGASVTAADITAGKLVYTPVANATAGTTYTFQVQDDGGTANSGVDLDPTARTMTVSITSVNDAPAGTAKTVTTLEDTSYTFTASDFGFTDPSDSPANALSAVKFTTLPTAGSLRNNGVAVTAGASVTAADITAGKLVYTPAANATGSPTFTFQVQDDGGTANGGVNLDPTARTMTVSIASVNDAPTDITLSAASIAENQPSGTVVGTLTSADVDAGDTFTYTLVSGTGSTDNASFTIQGNELRTAASFDFETKSSYTIRVRSTDQGGLSTEKAFAIAVIDVNEAPAMSLEFVTVGDVGNLADTDPAGYGAVNYVYRIGKYEVTNAQYAVFLNSVAATDPYGLFNTLMESSVGGGITRSGSDGGFVYAVKANMADRPVAYVSWFDAARFANWMHNGQGAGSTETGAYTMNGPTTGSTPISPRNAGAKFFIPTEDEWYKAAYYQGGTTNAYWNYATQSDTAPAVVTVGPTGVGSAGSTGNSANYSTGTLSSVGTNGGTSFYGTSDQVGNVLEWVDVPDGDKWAALRGGSYTDGSTYVRSAYRYSYVAQAEYFGFFGGFGFGFRLGSQVPEGGNAAPTDITLSAASVLENRPSGTVVGTLTSADPDAGNSFTYTLVSGTGSTDNASFTIQGNELRTASSFDFETKSSYTVRVRSTDQGGLFTEKAFTVSVTNVNEAPAGTAKTVTTLEDTAYTFTASDVGFTDPSDSPANALSAVKVTTLPAAGSLKNNGVAVTAGASVAAADIAAGKLVYTPVANASGSATFTFQVQDDGGTANGGVDLDPAPRSMMVSITSVNDAPAGTAKTVGTLKNTDYVFTVADFGFTDPSDAPANVMAAVKITTLPATGTLKNNGVAVTAGASVTAAAITAGKLVYAPAANATGTVTFTFQVQDDGGTANGGVDLDPTAKTMTVTVADTNAAPTDITLSAASVLENRPSGTVVGTLTSADPDAGNTFTYTLVSGTGSTDNSSFTIQGNELRTAAGFDFETKSSYSVRIRSTDQGGLFTEKAFVVSVANVNEAPAGTAKTVTTLEDTAYTFTTSDFGFTDPSDTPADALSAVKFTTLPTAGSLKNNGVAVTAGASVTAADITAGKLVYTPVANATVGTTFTFQVQDDGGTTNGGVNLDPTARTMTVSITSVNDVPTDITLSAASVAENQPSVTVVGTLTSADVDAGDTFTYTLVSGTGSTDNASFTIQGNELRTAASFDFETKSSYSIRVRSTDQGGLSTEKAFAISVTDVSEPPAIANRFRPVFSGPTQTFGVARLNTTVAGAESNNTAGSAVFSPDGTKVAFESFASNLVAGDTNTTWDIFVKDLATGAVARVSTDAAGGEANGGSRGPAFSPDGTMLAFWSNASNLVAGDTNGVADVFVKNLVTGAITRVSMSTAGGQGDGVASLPVFNADGTKVAFWSAATNLVPGDTNAADDVFVKDLVSGFTMRVSTSAAGAQGDAGSRNPAFSGDGTKLVFQSWAANLVSGDTNGASDIFVKDLSTGAITRVSTDATGGQGNHHSEFPAISPDGTRVAFRSTASNLVPDDTNGKDDVFVKNLVSGAIARISRSVTGMQGDWNSDAPVFSPDGGSVAFLSDASTLVQDDTNDTTDIFVRHLATGTVTRVSVSAAGDEGDGMSNFVNGFSPDGTKVLFSSSASNLVAGDTNFTADVFAAQQGFSLSAIDGVAAVATLAATDRDAGTTLTYSISGTDVARFTIDAATGNLAFVNPPSHATPADAGADNVYDIQVSVTDGLFTTSVPARITVTAPANSAPTGILISSAAVVAGQPVGTLVGTLSTDDPDVGDTFTYLLVDGDGSENNPSFAIAGNQLRTAASLAVGGYSLRIRSTDAGGLFTDRVVSITVSAPTSVVIDNGRGASTVGYFSNSIGVGGSITDGGVTARGRSGQVYVNENFIYEYGLFVDVGANGSARALQSTSVTMAPTLVSQGLVASEGSFDGVNGLVRWRVESSFDSTGLRFLSRVSFSSDQPIGALRVISYLDEDVFGVSDDVLNPIGDPQSPGFLVFTRDGTERVGFAQGGTYVAGPDLVNASYEGWAARVYPELRQAIVGTGTAFSVQGTIDPASLPAIAGSDLGVAYGPNDVTTAFAWKVDAAATTSLVTAALAVLPTDTGVPTGVVGTAGNGQVILSWTAATAAAETPITDYVVQYRPTTAADWTTFAHDASVATTVTVTGLANGVAYEFRVAAVNAIGTGAFSTPSAAVTPLPPPNSAPTDIAISSASVAENQPAGTVIGTLMSSDPDAGSTFTYTLVPGAGSTDNASFTIVGNELRSAATFDFESKPTYTVRVRTTDQGGLFTEKAFTVGVTNVNETATDIALSPASVPENLGGWKTVGTFLTNDPDAGDTFTYVFVSGPGAVDSETFVIEGNVLKTIATFDFETKSSYSVRVYAVDQGGLSTQKVFTILVTDVNEAPTDILLTGATIAENRPAGTAVGTLSAADPDAASSFTYTLVPGAGSADNGSFTIQGNVLQSAAIFDFETKSSYTVRVRATDQLGLFTERAFTVSVADVNEPPTAVSLSPSAGSVPENTVRTGLYRLAGIVVADDATRPNAITLSGADAASFQVVGAELFLRPEAALDFETKPSYTVTVTVSDPTIPSAVPVSVGYTLSVTDVTEPPGAPTAVTGQAGNGQVSLSWKAPAINGGAAITDYVIEYSGNGGTSYKRFSDAVSGGTTTLVTGLVNGTSYLFRVAAVNSAGTGGFSAASPAVAPKAVPGVPTGVTGVAGSGQVTLSWVAPAVQGGSAISDYRVQCSSDGGTNWATFGDAASSATSATVTGLTNGVAYVFRVAAVNGSGTGIYTAASAAITPRTVPGLPTGLAVTPDSGRVVFAWTAPAANGGAAITDYRVQYSSNNGNTWTTFTDATSTATSTTVTGLANGTAYVFRVAAVNAAGVGAFTAKSVAATPRMIPGVPTSVAGVPGDSRVTLSWAAPSSNGGAAITDYRVQYSSDNGISWSTSVDGVASATTATVTGLTNGVAYVFRVAAINVAGIGAFTAKSAAIAPRTVPGTPSSVSGVAGNGSVAVSWVAPSSSGGAAITDYRVQYSSNNGATWTTFADAASSATSATVTGLSNGVGYVFRVAAVNAAGVGAFAMRSTTVTPRTIPGVPTAVSGVAGNGTVTLSWTAPSSNGGAAVSAYRVQYSSNNGTTWTTFGDVTQKPATVTGLSNGKAYVFRLAAINAAGVGAFTAKSAAVTPRTVPSAPTGLTAVAVVGKVNLAWAAPASNGGAVITDYIVQHSSDSGTTWKIFGDTVSPATSVSVTGLTKGVSYVFRVVAMNAVGSGVFSSKSQSVQAK